MERNESRSVAAPVDAALSAIAQAIGRSGTHDVETLSATSLRLTLRPVPGSVSPGRLDNAIVVATLGSDGRSTITVAGRVDAFVLTQIWHALDEVEREHASFGGHAAAVVAGASASPRMALTAPDPRDRLPDHLAPVVPLAAPEPPPSAPSPPVAVPTSAVTPEPTEDWETVVLERTPKATLRLDSGTLVVIDERGAVMGRDPRADESRRPDVQLVVVEDKNRLVSRSHVALRLDGMTLLVEDLGSVNGSAVVYADGRGQPLQPGQPVELPLGARLRFGGCFADRVA